MGKALVEQTKLMFRWWHELKAGGLTRSGFQERMVPLMERVEALLEEGAACGHKKTAGKCRKILELRAALSLVRVAGGRRADEQRGGASPEAGRALAEGELRVGERAREPVRGADAHGRGDVPAAGPERAGLPCRGLRGARAGRARAFAPARARPAAAYRLNGYHPSTSRTGPARASCGGACRRSR